MISFTLYLELPLNLLEALTSTMGMGTLDAYCLVAWVTVEVEHEKGTHTRVCRMLHLDS
jgi:hypothetical protein